MVPQLLLPSPQKSAGRNMNCCVVLYELQLILERIWPAAVCEGFSKSTASAVRERIRLLQDRGGWSCHPPHASQTS